MWVNKPLRMCPLINSTVMVSCCSPMRTSAILATWEVNAKQWWGSLFNDDTCSSDIVISSKIWIEITMLSINIYQILIDLELNHTKFKQFTKMKAETQYLSLDQVWSIFPAFGVAHFVQRRLTSISGSTRMQVNWFKLDLTTHFCTSFIMHIRLPYS